MKEATGRAGTRRGDDAVNRRGDTPPGADARRAVTLLTEVVEALVAGERPEPPEPSSAPADLLPLARATQRLAVSVEQTLALVDALAHGDFSQQPPPRSNLMAAPVKELQSRLMELVWKVGQVGRGDYSQRVDFMGDLAESFNTMASQLEDREQEFRLMTFLDELTGLYNRRGLTVLGEQAMRGAIRNSNLLTCMYGDMDGLKAINDEHGHGAGDRALRDMAHLLRSTLREADIVARVGGDEFAVLVQADGAAVENMRDRLHEAVAAHNRQSSEPYTLSFSCGLSSALPGPDFSLGKLIQEADRQMYEAKRLRRGGASRG